MTQETSPLHKLLGEVNIAAASGTPLLAVMMCLALPDICSSLASQDGRSNADRYKAWCKDNLGGEFNFVTGDDLYSMRCGVLHNGRFGDLKHNVGRVIFALPNQQNNRIINSQSNDAYIYSVVDFCRNFTDAVAKWYEKNRESDIIKSNLPRLMQYREGGLPPYIRAATVLA
jgi:hypothetical protein